MNLSKMSSSYSMILLPKFCLFSLYLKSRQRDLPSAVLLPECPQQPRRGQARSLEPRMQSGSPKWVTGTQVLELSPAASQVAHPQEARIGSGTGTKIPALDTRCGHPKWQLNALKAIVTLERHSYFLQVLFICPDLFGIYSFANVLHRLAAFFLNPCVRE